MASAGSSVGSFCYSDCTTNGIGCLVVVACNCDDGVSAMDNCTNTADGTCYLGASGGVDYYCDMNMESACSLCGCDSQYLTGWSSTSTTGVVRRTWQDVDDSDYSYCYASTHSHYGCDSGYYMSSGSATLVTAMLTCSPCPPFQTTSGTVYGNTSTGNRSGKTACWLPSGTTSSFSDTIGSGTQKFTSTCYYSN